MSMSGDEAYVLAMDYVDETLEGGGALKGDDGKSAYQSWLDLGNTGTEEDFINSLKGEKGQVGEKGETGNNGKSSYEIWLDNGNVGTEQDFLDSLKGDGVDGFSPVITENSNNTDEDYRLDIETKESKFTTPNLKADIRKNIAEHNTSPDSHNDIRIFLNELNNRLNALANSDDETLDEMKEVVAYIKDNRSLIESITTTKVNVADIIDNLTTNVSNKPLSASQGVVIKNLIDTLQSELTAHINNFDIHVTPDNKTNWNNAIDKINDLKIADVNGLQTIADNLQFTSANLSQKGWYRIAEYKGSISHEPSGTYSNSCEIVIKRAYANTPGEEYRLLLRSVHSLQKFTPLSCNTSQQLFTKIRYVYNSTTAYIDVYYNISTSNFSSFLINDGKDYKNKWQAITPTLVAETVEGETVTTVFDIPANANPVTDLDLAKYLPLTGGKMTGIISINNDLAKVTPSPTGLSGSGHSQGIIFLNKDNAEFGTFGAMGTGGTFDKFYIGFGTNSWADGKGLDIRPGSIKWKGANLVTEDGTIASAKALVDNSSTPLQIGKSTKPVYFVDGKPEVCDLTIDAIQGLRTELDELRSLITNS